MSDLSAFLEARISEDEASAKAAASVAGPHWRHDTGWSEADHPYSQVRSPGGAIVADALRGPDDEEIGPFLARHDPARVLREVTAKRAILTRHSPVTEPGFAERDEVTHEVRRQFFDQPQRRHQMLSPCQCTPLPPRPAWQTGQLSGIFMASSSLIPAS